MLVDLIQSASRRSVSQRFLEGTLLSYATFRFGRSKVTLASTLNPPIY